MYITFREVENIFNEYLKQFNEKFRQNFLMLIKYYSKSDHLNILVRQIVIFASFKKI